MIAKTVIKTQSGSQYILEDCEITRLSEKPIIGKEALMVKNLPFIIEVLEVGKPARFQIGYEGEYITTSPVVEIIDYVAYRQTEA